jgi:hypothetical protein
MARGGASAAAMDREHNGDDGDGRHGATAMDGATAT